MEQVSLPNKLTGWTSPHPSWRRCHRFAMGYSSVPNQRLETDFHYRMLEERQGHSRQLRVISAAKPPVHDGVVLSSKQADRVDFPSSVWAAKPPVRNGVLVPPLEDGPPLSHVGRETIGHTNTTTVGSNKGRHCAISLCVCSVGDGSKVGE